MFSGRLSLRASAGLLSACALLSVSFAQTGKRPINHHDYDGWRTIAGQRLSADGKFLAYSLFPAEGDGLVVIRNLVTGKEQREPAGARPVNEPAALTEEGPPPPPRGVVLGFSADSRTLVFSTFPPKADYDKAKKDKKPMPKDGMTIVDLATGKATHVDRVKRFQLAEKANGFLVYQKEGPDAPAGAAQPPKPEGGDVEADQQGGRGGRGGANGGAAGRGPRPEFGSDMVIHNLADASERTLTDVVEFSFSEDGKQLVYAVAARDTSKNGVFVMAPGSSDAPVALLSGKGKYLKLTWDENQTQLAFISDRAGSAQLYVLPIAGG